MTTLNKPSPPKERSAKNPPCQPGVHARPIYPSNSHLSRDIPLDEAGIA